MTQTEPKAAADGFIVWTLNRSGTHFTDVYGARLAVRREAPRKQAFTAKIDGELIGVFPGLKAATDAAETEALARLRALVAQTEPKAAHGLYLDAFGLFKGRAAGSHCFVQILARLHGDHTPPDHVLFVEDEEVYGAAALSDFAPDTPAVDEALTDHSELEDRRHGGDPDDDEAMELRAPFSQEADRILASIPRLTPDDVAHLPLIGGPDETAALRARVAELEAEVERLRTPTPTPKADAGSWEWYFAPFEESPADGPWPSKISAIHAAISDETGLYEDERSFVVFEATNPPVLLSDWVEFDRVLERAEDAILDSDRVSSDYDDGGIFNATPEQEADLIAALKREADVWQARHGLAFVVRTFEDTRNTDHICLPADETQARAALERGPQ